MYKILVSMVIFLGGLVLYILATPDLPNIGLPQQFLAVLGLFMSTTVAIELLQDYVLKRFEKQDLTNTIANVVHKHSFESLGVYNIYARRAKAPTFGDILASFVSGEIWVLATSLSSVVPQYLDDIERKIESGKVEVFFMLLDPDSRACLEYGKSVGEEKTLELQIRANLEQIRRLKLHYPEDNGPLQVRLTNIVPHGSFIFTKDRMHNVEEIYYSPYRYHTPGVDVLTIELKKPIVVEDSSNGGDVFSDLHAVIMALWDSGSPLRVQTAFYPIIDSD